MNKITFSIKLIAVSTFILVIPAECNSPITSEKLEQEDLSHFDVQEINTDERYQRVGGV